MHTCMFQDDDGNKTREHIETVKRYITSCVYIYTQMILYSYYVNNKHNLRLNSIETVRIYTHTR